MGKKLEKIRAVASDGSWKTRLENAKRKTLYPLRESTLAKIREICDDLKENLALAVGALNIDSVVVAQQHFDTLLQTSSSLLKGMEAIEKQVSTIALDLVTLRSEQEDTFMAKIYEWLTPLTPVFRNKHRECLSTEVRQEKGAQKLLHTQEFQSWLSSTGTILWCTGLPGIGKTINVSYIVDFLEQKRRVANFGVAYIYFSYKEGESQTPANILASLLQQLVQQKPDHMHDLKDLYNKHVKENTRPSVGDISQLLQTVMYSFAKVFTLIDALHECSDTADVRSTLLTELKKLTSRMNFLVMSRPIPTLEKTLEGAVRIDVEASPADIRNYLEQRLQSTASIQKHLAEESTLLDTIVSRISQKIKGMFLMARLYLDTLVHKTTRRKIKSALDTLPDGLDAIYEELMNRIKLQNPKDHAELAIRVLGWIFHAVRPLSVTELQHALAVEQGDAYLDTDGIADRDLIVSVCAGMVMVNDNSDTISLVHYTTQEYFQRSGKRLLELAPRDIALTCLTYLRFDAFDYSIHDITSHDSVAKLLQNHALLSYAAQHWGDHLRSVNDHSLVGLAVEMLEDENKVHLLSWLKGYADSLMKRTYFRPRNKVLGLSLAASFGLTTIASELIGLGLTVHDTDSHGQNAPHRAVEHGHVATASTLLNNGATVDSHDLSGWTSLHQASARSNDSIVRLFLECDADVNVVDGYNATPLYRAAEAGTEKVVRLLLGKRAHVHVKNSYLQTALHRAADNGHLAVVEMLLKHGADPGAKDHYGYTPFYRAADQGHEDVAKILRAYISRS